MRLPTLRSLVTLSFALLLAVFASGGLANDSAGNLGAGRWSGVIRDSRSPLQVDLNLRSSEGTYTGGSIDVPETGFLAMAIQDLEVEGERISFSCEVGEFEGALADGRIEGVWSLGERTAPFELTHQPDRPLFNVHTEDVEFTSSSVTLSGTLHLPLREGRSAAAVLIHGSGREDRNGQAKYATLLARNGVVALTYDKRGVGQSGGDENFFRRFDLSILADDALAGAELLIAHPAVRRDSVGLIGVSQGGWVAPLAASRSEAIGWMVGISASAATVAEDRLFERAARLSAEGFTDEEVAQATEMQRVDQEVTRTGERFDELSELWSRHQDARWFRRVYLDDAPAPADNAWRLWYRTQLDFDPYPLLEELEIPAHWLFGDPELDRLAPVAASIDRLERLRSEGKPYRIEWYPEADHNLSVEAGWPGRIWAPGSLEDLVDWVIEITGDGPLASLSPNS